MLRKLSARLVLPALLMFALLTPCGAAPDPAEPARPNIILIMADDLGWMDAAFQGNPLVDTTNLDRLAKQGMRFTDADDIAESKDLVQSETAKAAELNAKLDAWLKSSEAKMPVSIPAKR